MSVCCRVSFFACFYCRQVVSDYLMFTDPDTQNHQVIGLLLDVFGLLLRLCFEICREPDQFFGVKWMSFCSSKLDSL